jgi:hypothetical protein
MDRFIYEKENLLSDDICKDIIESCEQYFEEQKLLNDNKEEKEPIRLDIALYSINNEFWSKIKDKITSKIINVMKEYYSKFDEDIYHLNKLHKELVIENITLNKYLPNKETITNICDFNICEEKYYRILSYVFYLNDINNGGESIFENGIIIKPKQGKVVLYPSDWLFTRREEKIITDSKYIITGWINVSI